MSLKRYFQYILLTLLTLVFASCSNKSGILHTIDDLNGRHIAILNHAVSDKEFKEQFPESDLSHFKSSSEFLLAIAIGKCNAGIINREEGEYLLSKNPDYISFSYDTAAINTNIIIAHKTHLHDYHQLEQEQEDDLLDKSIRRVHRSVISDGYWLLLIKGFATTITLFISGILIAFALAILMLWMNRQKHLKYISKPLSFFIRTIHDVPSIVLIFFFYYIVFATANISGIIVCAISLGVYTSGSFMNIFTVHLNQVDKNQHAAAQMLGLTGWKKYRYVILPQAVKPMLPLIGAEAKGLLRATTYAGYISEIDLVKVTEIIRNQTYDILVPLLLVSIIFLLMSKVIVKSLSILYNKFFIYD